MSYNSPFDQGSPPRPIYGAGVRAPDVDFINLFAMALQLLSQRRE